MQFILAIDQSTSATKAMLFDVSGRLVDKVSIPHEQIYPRPGWVEHDAEEIYFNTLAAARELLAKNQNKTRDILCLSITNQRETFVVFDRESGKPLHNAIVWQCRRGEPICARLNEEGHGTWVQERTGLKIDTYFPAPKLNWLLENEPDLRRELEQGNARVGTIDTYLIYRLTEGSIFATDHTNASRTLLFDIGKMQWDESLCELFGVPVEALPEARECSDDFGETTITGAIKKPIPIRGVMGDSQAALFAQRSFEIGSAKVTFGSGSSLLLNIGNELRVPTNGIVTTIGWTHDGLATYAYEGITNFTGGTIAWLHEQLKLISSPQETEELANRVEDNGGVYLVPAFVGLSAPYWRSDVRAAILGLTPSTTRDHVVRAALESIAYIVNDVLVLMGQEAEIDLRQIRADGGAIKNRFLMQFVSDITQLNVLVSELPELSALGSVFAGLLGLDVYSSVKELETIPLATIEYTPSMDSQEVQKLISGWSHAVNQVLSSGKNEGETR